jgi:hypothetical protein
MKAVMLRVLLAIAPFAFTGLFGWLTMEGHLNFGGGEKDIFLLIPLLLWSLVWFISVLVLWWRRSPVGRSLKLSGAFATAFVVIAWVILFAVSLLKSH